ncbi:MAG: acyltransferase family protein [Prevotella sp.]
MRTSVIDFLKGIAIIAVILYHCGIATYGYLGVEIFFTIAGYLTTKSLLKNDSSQLNYFAFIKQRLIRLYPIAVLACIVSFVVGYHVMLPDYLKNTCETVVGTCTFTNNFVQHITSGNYWDTSNDFKPLMHTWYIGVIFQFYLIFLLIILSCKKFSKSDFGKNLLITLSVIGVLSYTLYITPETTDASRFYMLPCRLFEFITGSIIAIVQKQRYNTDKASIIMSVSLILIMMFGLSSPNPNIIILSSVTILTAIAIYKIPKNIPSIIEHNFIYQSVVKCGQASYSLFIWHQVIIAFWLYTINDALSFSAYCAILTLSLIIGFISYYILEQKVASILNNRKRENLYLAASLLCGAIISLLSFHIYREKGIVRDIPELSVTTSGKNEDAISYNERISYLYKGKDFPNNDRQNILIIGDSFGRDWCNILIECGYETNYNLSYINDIDSTTPTRINKADIIYIANNGSISKYIDILPLVEKKKYYRVGTKGFGKCMGKHYNAQRDQNYYHQKIDVPENIASINDKEKEMFGDNYIDLMSILSDANGQIPIFTPNKKFFSHDGLHLTRAGARRFAELMK